MGNELFETAPIPKAYMKLALPVVMGMIVSLVYNMVDTYFIALTGNTSLVAGVSLVAPIFTMMIAFGDIWGLGGSSLISRLLGEKKYEEAKKACSFSFWAAIGWGLLTTAVLLIFKSQILHVLGADSATADYAGAYYTWIAIGAAAIILGLVPSNLMRTEGLALQAMIGSIMGSIINIILDPIFIFTLKQGAAGAAIATVIGNVVADLYYAYVILKKSQRLSIDPRLMRVPAAMVRGVLSIGIPASITNLMQSLMIMLTNHYLLTYGNDKVAAMGIALKVNMITALILVGFAFGGQPLIGYNYGAKNRARLHKILKFAFSLEVGLGAVLTALMCLFAPTIIRFFMDDPGIVENGAKMLRFLQLGMVFMSVGLVATVVCQSIGNALGALILAISRQGILYAIVIAVASHMAGLNGVLLSQAVSDFLTAVIAVVIVVQSFRNR